MEIVIFLVNSLLRHYLTQCVLQEYWQLDTLLPICITLDEILNIICLDCYLLVVFFCPQGMVDVVFADVAQPDQARIVAINAHHFLKNQGHFVISIKASN